MTRRSCTRAATTAAAACLALHTGLGAQSSTSLYSPVILLSDFYGEYHSSSARDGGPIQMREDGSGFMYFSWPVLPGFGPFDVPSDLTHNGAAGSRYLLGSLVSSEETPDGRKYIDLVAFREDGDPSTLRVLTLGTTTDVDRSRARWSTDGRRVVYSGQRWQDGALAESGVYMAEVDLDGTGAPVALSDERLVVANDPTTGMYVGGGLLASDGVRLAYGREHHYLDANNQPSIEPLGLFMTTVPRPDAAGTLPPAGPEVPLGITARSAAFSTAPGDSRLAYTVDGSRWKSMRYLHIVDVPSGYDGSVPLKPVYVGTKAYPWLNNLSWSPDGNFLLFTAADRIDLYKTDVWKMRSNGSGKAVRLTPSSDGYTILGWRR